MRSLIAGCFSLILLGCGGSGGSSTGPRPLPSPSLPDAPILKQANNYILYGDSQAVTGSTIGFGLANTTSSPYSSVKWRQLSGPNVVLPADHSQWQSIEVSAAGTYQFEVQFNTAGGQRLTETIEVSASDSSQPDVNVRLDHMVSEQGNVSLYVDYDQSKTPTSFSWKQVSGNVSVSLDQSDQSVFFTAPEVTQDKVVGIEATVNFDDGSQGTDIGYVLIQNTPINSDGYFPRYSEKVVTSLMKPYRPQSPYATALMNCVYNNQVEASCSFGNLPLIGSVTMQPSVDDILDRLLVSHDWMGDRFEQFLRDSATQEDMLSLLRATTAIVISYDVRPSFYWTATGAIYLDAANFWRTPQERDSLNTQPDYRSSFGDELQFLIPWRYVKDGDYYTSNGRYPRNERNTKTFADMEANITWLMYHELAHANDFFPPTSWQSLRSSQSPLSYANSNEANSEAFSIAYPLTSETMRRLAQVSFAGLDATATQRNYQPDEVSDFFRTDTAPAYYSYSTIREDYATLFERFMMIYRLGASADVAIVERDELGDYPVSWGQRNRISEASIQGRTRYVVQQILPELDVSAIQATLPAPALLNPGISYFDQLSLGDGQQKNMIGGKSKKGQGHSRDIRLDLLYPHPPPPRVP